MTVEAGEGINAAERRAGAGPVGREAAIGYRRLGTLSSATRDPDTAETVYFIKAPSTDVLQFGEKEYFLWRLLDGTNSLPDIQTKFRLHFKSALTAEQFDSFVEELIDCGVVERLKPAMPEERAKPEEPGEPGEPALPLAENRLPQDLHLFDPSAALGRLDWICGPLRFYRWLLLPALVGVLVWAALDAAGIAAAVAGLRSMPAGEAAGLLLLGLVLAVPLVTVLPPLSEAVVVSFLGVETPSCRLRLRARALPHLGFADAGWRAVPARAVLLVVATPSLARLVLFLAGTGIALAAGEAKLSLAVPAMVIGLVALASFLVGAAPFLPGDGRRWLETAFGRGDPWRAGGGYRAHAAMLSVAWLAAVAGVLLIAAATVLPHFPVLQGLRSAAFALLIAVAVVARVWIRGMLSTHGTLQPSYPFAAGYGGAVALDPAGFVPERPWPSRAQDDSGPPPPGPRRQASGRWERPTTINIWAVILGLAIAFGFLSYPYEAGGNFTILPYGSSQVRAGVQGMLTEVLVHEGEIVKPGQILGILSDWDEKYQLAVAKAQLQNAQATLQNLLHSPQPDDVELALKQYQAAMARLPYDKKQFQRYAALVVTNNVTPANYDQVLSQYQQDKAAAAVARANYDQIRSGPTPDQIEAARAVVRQDTATVAYDEDQLERTRIRATSYGTMVTPDPMLLRGEWFTQGALVFTVEDHHVMQADVQVPESDIDHVRLGARARLRLWGSPGHTEIGKVVAIAPDALTPTTANPQDPQSSSSNVIPVRVELPNPDGRLHPQTDGYAKIVGPHMPAWKAFGQMLERFFLVEIWSWIP